MNEWYEVRRIYNLSYADEGYEVREFHIDNLASAEAEYEIAQQEIGVDKVVLMKLTETIISESAD